VRRLKSLLTLVGWGWPVARQLSQLAVLVFSSGTFFDRRIENYLVLVFVGLTAWTWFTGAVCAARCAERVPSVHAAAAAVRGPAVRGHRGPLVDFLFALRCSC
jgi:hypothetical protein